MCILLVFLTIYTPHTLNFTALNVLYRTNGIVHSLTACSEDWPALCQKLSWTSQSHINNQKQTIQVQRIKGRTLTVLQMSLWKHQDCCNNRKCNWNGAKWNSCTDPHEQVLLWQPFPGRVAVCEHLQSHRPEWQQLKTPKYSTGSFPNGKPAGARSSILASTAEVKKDMDTCTPPNTPVQF